MKQVRALDILKTGRNVYLTGPAGSGKTYVLNQYIHYLREHGVSVATTASTGIAATHIGGMTIHSWCGLGHEDELSEAQVSQRAGRAYLKQRLTKTQVLIIDEVSMLTPSTFESISRICQRARGHDAPFGGMQVVLSGDFFQLPPVVKGSTTPHFIPTSPLWDEMNIRVCYLEEQFRQTDNTLERILAEMRTGEMCDESIETLLSCQERAWGSEVTPTRLYTHNMDVDRINHEQLEKLPGELYSYTMKSEGRKKLVESLKKGLLAPETLWLKQDAAVMFIKNNFDAGYVNGTLGVVETFEGNSPIVRTFEGKRIKVSNANWDLEEDGETLARVLQLPLRLAWAITIHKSQGMSLDAAEIDLSKTFVAGQGYVALSRVRTLDGLLLRGLNPRAFAVHPEVHELDIRLKRESARWERAVDAMDDTEVTTLQQGFLLRMGGTLKPQVYTPAKTPLSAPARTKTPAHEQTKTLIAESSSLEELAEKRGVTVGTVLSHLEKLRKAGEEASLLPLKPPLTDLLIIRAAFEKTEGRALTPVYTLLEGVYPFETLRLARLFIGV